MRRCLKYDRRDGSCRRQSEHQRAAAPAPSRRARGGRQGRYWRCALRRQGACSPPAPHERRALLWGRPTGFRLLFLANLLRFRAGLSICVSWRRHAGSRYLAFARLVLPSACGSDGCPALTPKRGACDRSAGRRAGASKNPGHGSRTAKSAARVGVSPGNASRPSADRPGGFDGPGQALSDPEPLTILRFRQLHSGARFVDSVRPLLVVVRAGPHDRRRCAISTV